MLSTGVNKPMPENVVISNCHHNRIIRYYVHHRIKIAIKLCKKKVAFLTGGTKNFITSTLFTENRDSKLQVFQELIKSNHL